MELLGLEDVKVEYVENYELTFILKCWDYLPLKLIYQGRLVNKSKEGYGRLWYPQSENLFYEGQFKNDQIFGKDIQFFHDFPYNSPDDIYPLLTIKAIKENPFDELIGALRLTYKNGQVYYEGSIKNGQKDGQGCEFYPNGNLRYNGLFKKDGYHGKNLVIYNSRDVDNIMIEDGNFNEGKLDGKIDFLWFRDNIKNYFSYCLLWNSWFQDGVLHSPEEQGKHATHHSTPIMDCIFQGFFYKGRKNGYGEIYCDESQKYIFQGDFKDGLPWKNVADSSRIENVDKKGVLNNQSISKEGKEGVVELNHRNGTKIFEGTIARNKREGNW